MPKRFNSETKKNQGNGVKTNTNTKKSRWTIQIQIFT